MAEEKSPEDPLDQLAEAAKRPPLDYAHGKYPNPPPKQMSLLSMLAIVMLIMALGWLLLIGICALTLRHM